MTIEEIETRAFEVETARGIARSDDPTLQVLTKKMYLFVLLWTDPDTIVKNKTEWAKENGFNRADVYIYLGDRRVVDAIAFLDSSIHSAEASQVLKVVQQQALKGCTKSQKLYLDRYRQLGDAEQTDPNQEDSLSWDTSLSKSKPVQDNPNTTPPQPIQPEAS
jgi:hypothetical protein